MAWKERKSCPTQFQCGGLRGILQPAAHLQHVLTEVLEHHMAASRGRLHSPAVGDVQRAQLSPRDLAVEAAQNTVHLVGELCDKLLHGVPFSRDTCLETHRTKIANAFPVWLRLRRAKSPR